MVVDVQNGCAPLEPQTKRAPRQEVEVAEDGGARVLVVDELVQEEMDHDAERVKRKVANVFGKDEKRKRDRERNVGEGRLQR